MVGIGATNAKQLRVSNRLLRQNTSEQNKMRSSHYERMKEANKNN